MSGRRPARRATARLAAGAVTFSLTLSLLSACGDDAPDTTSLTTPTPDGVVPSDHGLAPDLVAEVLRSTVGISGVACGRLANGSGFAIADDLVVTNAHVILGIDDIRVHTFDGAELAATAVAYDPDADLAILDVADAAFAPLPLAGDPAEGTIGMLVGWETAPFPDPTPFRLDRRVTVRIETVGGTDRVERPSWLLAADIDSGDSGGALVDGTGEVVGVAFAASKHAAGVGYAVRASAIETLMSGGLDPNLTVPGC